MYAVNLLHLTQNFYKFLPHVAAAMLGTVARTDSLIRHIDRKFHTAYTKVCQWTRSRATSIQLPSSQLFCLKLNVISHLLLGLPSCRFPRAIPTKIRQTFVPRSKLHVQPIVTPCVNHEVPLYVTTSQHNPQAQTFFYIIYFRTLVIYVPSYKNYFLGWHSHYNFIHERQRVDSKVTKMSLTAFPYKIMIYINLIHKSNILDTAN
jgi:hypothetical protein